MAENWGNEMRLVRIEDLRHCLMAAFERLELPREDAEQVVEVLLDSELRGHEATASTYSASWPMRTAAA